MYRIRKPSAIVSPYVKHYWMLETCVSNEQYYKHRIIPNGLFELTFYLDSKPIPSDCSKYTYDSQFTGQLKGYYDIKISGNLKLFSVYFKPQGLCKLLNIPLKELYDQVIPLDYFFRDEANKLEEELHKANLFEERIHIIEKFLIRKIHSSNNNDEFNRINHCIELINQQNGSVKIDQLASACCLSRKQFERIFSKNIGTTPKQFLKIVRFQNALYNKSINPDISLTQLGYTCGYFDQSHMITDFSTLSGLTPKQYFSDCDPSSDYFQNS